MTTTPGAEIHPNVPFDEYLAWPQLSQSSLKEGRRSMAHLYSAWQDGIGVEPTDDMLLGSALHCAFLEPELMPQRVVVYPKVRRGKEWESFKAEHKGKIILTRTNYDHLVQMLPVLRKHKFTREWYSRIEDVEVSTVGEWCGVPLKARCDALTDEPLVDLKKVRDGDQRLFERQIYSLGYHIQGAVYCELFNRDRFVFLTVEGTPPYDVVPYALSKKALAIGRQEAIGLLQGVKHCLENECWPGRSDETIEVDVPEWADTSDEELTDGGINEEERAALAGL